MAAPYVAMSGSDTILINRTLLTSLADDNVVELTYPNEIASVKTGKNGNSIYGLNTTGQQADVKVRVLRASASDIFLLNLLNSQNNNFAGFVLMTATFIKKIGDGKGNVISDTYVLSGGVFTKNVEAESNVTGESKQSVSMYTMRFSNSPRAIG